MYFKKFSLHGLHGLRFVLTDYLGLLEFPVRICDDCDFWEHLVFRLLLALFRLVGLSKRRIIEPSLTVFRGFSFVLRSCLHVRSRNALFNITKYMVMNFGWLGIFFEMCSRVSRPTSHAKVPSNASLCTGVVWSTFAETHSTHRNFWIECVTRTSQQSQDLPNLSYDCYLWIYLVFRIFLVLFWL